MTEQPSVARFTPGPWRESWDYKRISRDSRCVIANACGPQHVYPGHAPFPDAPDILQPTAATMERVYADARLISAAPDLYAARLAAQEELRLIRMKDHGTVYNPALSTQMALALQKAAPQTDI